MDATGTLFAQSALIGLSIAAPVGQIGVLAIQRTLHDGTGAGFATGLGAALADAVYGAIGAFGVAAMIDWLVGARPALALFGSAFLAWLALRIWRQPAPARSAAAPSPRRWLRHLSTTFLLTLSNPTTILSFVAVFGLLAGRTPSAASPWTMVAGVFAGSAAWWLLLALVVGRLRQRVDAHWWRRINRTCALVLAAFALASLAAWLAGLGG